MQLLYTSIDLARFLAINLGSAYVLYSGLEYCRHRFLQHRGIVADRLSPAMSAEHEGHHRYHTGFPGRQKLKERLDELNPAAKEADIEIAYRPAACVAGLAAVVMWMIFGPWSALCTLLLGVLHPVAYNAVHRESHFKDGRWFCRNRLFKHLWWRHFLHHRRWTGNFNVIYPLWDLLLWTWISPTDEDRSDFQDLWNKTQRMHVDRGYWR